MDKPLQEPKPVGVVTHYYPHPHVAVIQFTKDIPIGTYVRIHGATTDFEEEIDSMEHNHHLIMVAERGQEVGVKVFERAREGDRVYAMV